MAFIDGQASLLKECRLNPPDLQGHLAEQFAALLNEPGFNGAAAGWPSGQRTSDAAYWGQRQKRPLDLCADSNDAVLPQSSKNAFYV